MTPDDVAALDIARRLVAVGIPVFVAHPDPSKPTGFALPKGWQQTQPDPAVVELWRPGLALGAVMGHGLDLLDLDPRSGADLSSLGCPVPVSYGVAATPSGGIHSFIRSLGVRERDKVAPGIDVKAGAPDGRGRGFAFIAPTIRLSKVDGQPRPYRWLRAPDLDRLARDGGTDRSGEALAALIERLRAHETSDQAPTPEQFLRASPWTLDVDKVLAAGRHAGVIKLAAALRGRGGWRFEDALNYMWETVWPKIDQTQGGHEYPLDEFEADIADVWTRYPDGNAERTAQFEAAIGPTPVPPTVPEGTQIPVAVSLTDAYLAQRVSEQCLYARFMWVHGLGWMAWDGRRWIAGDETLVTEQVRQYFIGLHNRAANAGADLELLKKLSGLLANARINGVTRLCRGVAGIYTNASQLDAHPDLLNTPGGVVNLRTGQVSGHDPGLLLTKITKGSYRPGLTHPDWTQALEALPTPERVWFQTRIGQAITGYPTPDGVMPILQGGGENGKSALTSDGLLPALGDYASPASAKLFQGHKEHSTERADLRGQRLLVAEEMTEGRAIDTTALKQIQDVGEIKARYVHKDNFTFAATHSLFVTTNYMPIVNETDHGTWRRLAVLRFPYTFRKPGEPLEHANDRVGDPGLKMRMRRGAAGRHNAAVTWAVEGAQRWYEAPETSLLPTPTIQADTAAWRAEADRVLGYWQERLVSDPNACITTLDTLDDFNDWLRGNGHNAWSKELFAPRFKAHFETIRNGVEEVRPRIAKGLVKRAPNIGMPRKDEARPRVYINVRFRIDSDAGHDNPSELPGPSGPTPSPNGHALPSVTEPREGLTECLPANGAVAPDVVQPTLIRENPPVVQLVQPLGKLSLRDLRMEEVCQGVGPPGPDLGPAVSAGQTGLISENSDNPTGEPHKTPGQPVFRNTLLDQVVQLSVTGDLEVDVMPGQALSQPSKPQSVSRVTAKNEAKARAIADAAGPIVELPALVTRTGLVAHVSLEQADIAIAPAINRELTVDVETTGFPVGHQDHKLRTVQLGDASLAVVFDAADHGDYIRGALERATKLHAHSATADIIPLAHAGLLEPERAWHRMYDTVIPAKLADPASTGSDPALKRLADAVLDDPVSTKANEDRGALFKAAGWLTETKVTTPVERSGWAQVDPRCRTMVKYAAADVLDTAALADRLPAVDPALLERERTVQRLTARVAHRGLKIDGEHVQELLAVHAAARAQAAERVRAYGVGNPGSSAQIGAQLIKMKVTLPATPKGAPSVAAGVLEKLKRDEARWTDVGTFVAAVLEYREHDTAIGLFLEPYQQLVQRGDGRARPTVYTLAADTGRMSCVRPNLQQVPREGGFRACIMADPGHMLISADFSSVELRVMAALSQDSNMIRMLLEGADFHALVAEQVFGPEWTKRDRYTVKRGVFGWAYGGSIPTLAAQVGVSESIMASVVDVLADMAPTYVQWSQGVKDLVRQGRTQFETYAGRIVHLSQRTPHKAPNYCIQGTARELLVDALLHWQETRWGTATLFPVHDEIVVSVPEDEADEATKTLVDAMSSSIYGVPILGSPSKPTVAWADAA